MTAHTPGKWGFDDEWVFSDSHLAGKGDIVCLNPALEGFEHSAKRWEANARLIAAAPELLEALQFYMAQFGQALDAHGITYGEAQMEADRAARTAIAKAKGESDGR